MKPSKKLIVFLVLSVLLISFAFYGYQICFTPNILVGKQSRVLVIPPGKDFKYIQDQFHKYDIAQDLISFSFLAKLMDYDEKVKPGRFVLSPNMTNLQLLRMLRSGKQVPVRVTFNNVRLIRDLSEKISKNLGFSAEEFEAALIDYTMKNPHGFNKDNIMAMFIPNTYEVYYNVGPDEFIEKMYAEYSKFWTAERKAQAKEIGLTPMEVSILASIVQAETIKSDEAPTIAGLYMNRLNKGMALQADPTLVFAVGDFTIKRVLNEHKQVDSPYNTYKNTGLPPGPINMPEIKSLNAVLNYKKSNYIYMCAKEDFSGYHNFTDDYKKHMDNAARYQRALTAEMKKAEQMGK